MMLSHFSGSMVDDVEKLRRMAVKIYGNAKNVESNAFKWINEIFTSFRNEEFYERINHSMQKYAMQGIVWFS
jgi:hypothetical protein